MLRLSFIAAIVIIFSLGCTSEGTKTVVSGKTVYSGMGIEGAEVTALTGGVLVAQTLSSYHGSFIIHLPPGEYYLRANAKVPQADVDIAVRGETFGVKVGKERLDQITIKMMKGE